MDVDSTTWSKEVASFDKESLSENTFLKLLPNDLRRGNIRGDKPDKEVLMAKSRLAFTAHLLGAETVAHQWLADIVAEMGYSVSIDAKLLEEQNTSRLVSNRPAPGAQPPQQPPQQY